MTDDLVAFVRERLDETIAERSSEDWWVRWDAAMRAVVELHEAVPSGWNGQGPLQCDHCADQCHSGSGMNCDSPDAPWPCPTVRHIAAIWETHEGFREEWR